MTARFKLRCGSLDPVAASWPSLGALYDSGINVSEGGWCRRWRGVRCRSLAMGKKTVRTSLLVPSRGDTSVLPSRRAIALNLMTRPAVPNSHPASQVPAMFTLKKLNNLS